MKITGIKTVIVNAVHRNWIFVKVLTDQPGLHGWGEATLEWKTRAVTATIEDLEPFIIGEDPMNIEHLVRKMTHFSFWPLGSIGLTAVSGIEHALWDIKGKALGVPVWQLLGGKVRDKVRVYTHMLRGSSARSIPPGDISAFCDAVQETVEMGYDAVKLGFVPYTGYDAPLKAVKYAEKLSAAVRERVGDEVDIMTDFHGRPDSLDAAIAYIKAIEPIKPLFCEEVIQPGDTPAMADIARRVDCPLATGERLFTPREFAEVSSPTWPIAWALRAAARSRRSRKRPIWASARTTRWVLSPAQWHCNSTSLHPTSSFRRRPWGSCRGSRKSAANTRSISRITAGWCPPRRGSASRSTKLLLPAIHSNRRLSQQ
jgi:galactonate dehydratase